MTPFKLLLLCLIGNGVSNLIAAELPISDELVAEAMKVLSEVSTFDERFYTGYSASLAPQSIAMLLVLSSDDPVDRFRLLTARPGVPALYGLAGLWLCDPTRTQFQSARDEVLKRDGLILISSRRHDIVSKQTVESHIVGSKDNAVKSQLKVGFGSHISNVFKLRSEVPTATIDNGVLPHMVTSPWWEYFYLSDANRASSKLDQSNHRLASISADKNLVYKEPARILELLELDDTQIREILRHGM